jgi:hypothetical protein
MGRSLGSGMRGFKDSLSGEPGQAAALEQAPVAAVEEPSTVVAATNDSGASRVS